MCFENRCFSGWLPGLLCVSALGGVSPRAEAVEVVCPVAAEPVDEAKWTNSAGMEFVRIPAGSFPVVADRNFEETGEDGARRRRVTISQPFYLGKTEVTQAQWMAVMDGNPSEFKGDDRPVENVSWWDVQEFIERLDRQESTKKYRLPTEAEWEYAARAGTTTQYSFGDDKTELDRYAWFGENAGGKTHPAGQKGPNPWGLHDMHGNVWEWVQDWYGEDYYVRGPETDPQGPFIGVSRVLRGGGWFSAAGDLRSAGRSYGRPNTRFDVIGFRLAFSVDTPPPPLLPPAPRFADWESVNDAAAERPDTDLTPD